MPKAEASAEEENANNHPIHIFSFYFNENLIKAVPFKNVSHNICCKVRPFNIYCKVVVWVWLVQQMLSIFLPISSAFCVFRLFSSKLLGLKTLVYLSTLSCQLRTIFLYFLSIFITICGCLYFLFVTILYEI